MKTLLILLVGVLAVINTGRAAAPSGHDLYQKALVQEQTSGDLEAAILVYEKLARDYADDRPLAAKALLRIAQCKQKLGQQEALAAYQAVLERYPEQQEVAAAAKAAISSLSPADARSQAPTFEKVKLASKLPWDAQLSPDGQRILFVQGKKLWLAPRASGLGAGYSGTPKLLDTAGIEAGWFGVTWSGDGRWIAFNGDQDQTIYVLPAEGGTPRKVHECKRDFRIVNYRMSLSPDGKKLAFAAVENAKLQIYVLPLEGGTPKKLIEAPAREPVFSPDGKTLAYVEDEDLGRRGGGLWVIPAEGGEPRRVATAQNASSPVWSPDGGRIAFVDYGNKTNHLRITRWNGQGAAAEEINIDCRDRGFDGVTRLIGWSPDNELGAVCEKPQEYALLTLPLQGGKAAFITHKGYPMQPRWTPDGLRILHLNALTETSGDWEQLAPTFVPAEGGPLTTVSLRASSKIRLGEYGTANRLSPDGSQIVFAGQKHEEGRFTRHVWTIPAQGGEATQLTDAPAQFTDWYPCWSPDGKSIAFVRAESAPNLERIWKTANLFTLPSGGGEARQITVDSDRVFSVGPVVWSPDGALLAFFSQDNDSANGAIKVIPPTGGAARVVAKVEAIYANKEMAWSPDSRRIAYNSPGEKIKIVTVADGQIEDVDPALEGVILYHLDWSPDGKRLVFGGVSGGGSEFLVIRNFLRAAGGAK